MQLKDLLKNKPPLIWSQPPSDKTAAIRNEIESLQASPLPKLREAWALRYGKPVPAPTSRSLLLRLLAWRIQADAFGGHSPDVLKILNEPIGKQTDKAAKLDNVAKLRTGSVLKRDWQGRECQVIVKADGFAFEGKTYKSLSETARAITGTRWSGPKFFGLKSAKRTPSAGSIP